MSQSTTSPLHAMPVLDVPFPRTVAAASPMRPAGAASHEASLPKMAFPSTKKTILGVAPTADDDSPANRPTLPDAPRSRARPGRTIVGVGPSMGDHLADDPPELVTEPARIDVTNLEAPNDPAFEPSPFARDPGLGAAESIRLPRRRIEPGDWLLLVLVVALIAVVLTLLF